MGLAVRSPGTTGEAAQTWGHPSSQDRAPAQGHLMTRGTSARDTPPPIALRRRQFMEVPVATQKRPVDRKDPWDRNVAGPLRRLWAKAGATRAASPQTILHFPLS